MKPWYWILTVLLSLSACAPAGIQPIEAQPTTLDSAPTSPSEATALPEAEATSAPDLSAGSVAEIPAPGRSAN